MIIQNINKLIIFLNRKTNIDFNYFIKNGFWSFLGQLISLGIGLILTTALVRLLSKEVYGQYQFIISIFATLSILSIPGLNTSIIQSVARGYDGSYKKSVKLSFFSSLIGIPIILIIGGYYYIHESQILGLALMCSTIFFPFFYTTNTWDYFLIGKSKFKLRAKWGAITSMINMFFTLGIVFFYRENLLVLVIAYFASYSIFNGIRFWKSLKLISNHKIDKNTITYGWFLTKISFSGTIAENIDRILVGVILGPQELAIYHIISLVAIKIKNILKIPLHQLVFPKLAISNKSFFTLLKDYKKNIIILLLLMLIVVTFFYFCIPIINQILFGQKYAQYSNLSKYFCVAIFFAMPIIFMSTYIFAKKDQSTLIITKPIFDVIKITINLFLIYKFKLLGAVLAFNLSMVIWFCLHLGGIIYTQKKN